MKQIIKDYKKELMYFFTNKKYILSIIFVAILSYGFAITHYSVGMDDLCFDRYVSGTYILSAKRWGTWLLYNILNIKEFTPFWLDFIVSTLMVVISTLICAFIKRQVGDKIKIWVYVLFSSIFISNPIINQFFLFQSTNLSIAISNIIIVVSVIMIFENYFNVKKSRYYIFSSILISIALSMYESCMQTYFVLLFISLYINVRKKEIKLKELSKYFCIGTICFIFGMVGYLITGFALLKFLGILNILQKNYAVQSVTILNKNFLSLGLKDKIDFIYQFTNYYIYDNPIKDIKDYLPIQLFFISTLIVFVLELVKLIKTKKASSIIIFLGMILSNFILIVVQFVVLYRTQFSWILTTAFLCTYIYYKLSQKGILKYIISIVAILLIIFQTKDLNQLFYNDYRKFEYEKVIANNIAKDIINNTDYKDKPIIYIYEGENKNNFRVNYDNGIKVLQWGTIAFKEKGTEATKFINHFGYNFLYSTEEQYNEAMEEYELLDENIKNNPLIELDKYIIINLDKYGI